MNEFENRLIVKEEVFQNGFFPKVPTYGKRDSVILLTGGSDSDVIVDEHTTSKQIRKGKYTKLVEISTAPYRKDIKFHSPSKETYYCFDVSVTAVIQVNDPIAFYLNKNIDVDVYFDNLFSMDVRKITRKYSILNFDGMDDELAQRLSSYDTVDPLTGFRYQISAVDATPGENAQGYVKKHGDQKLNAELRRTSREEFDSVAATYEEAICAEVVEGKLSETEAILKIKEYRDIKYDERIKRLEELRDKDFITDKQARAYAAPAFEMIDPQKQIQEHDAEPEKIRKSGMDEFYTEEEE